MTTTTTDTCEAAARALCVADGKNPDAMWPGVHWKRENCLHDYDAKENGQPVSYAWRAYTDPPQFRRAQPPVRPAHQIHADTVARMEPEVAAIDHLVSLASIAISLRRLADHFEAASTRTEVSVVGSVELPGGRMSDIARRMSRP